MVPQLKIPLAFSHFYFYPSLRGTIGLQIYVCLYKIQKIFLFSYF